MLSLTIFKLNEIFSSFLAANKISINDDVSSSDKMENTSGKLI